MNREKKPGTVSKAARRMMLQREVKRLADSAAELQSKTSDGQSERPEHSAPEQMKNISVEGVQAAVHMGTQGAKQLYIRGEMLREKIQQKKPDLKDESGTFENSIPSVEEVSINPPKISNNATVVQSESPPSQISPQETAPHQPYAKKMVGKQSEEGTQAAKRFYVRKKMLREKTQQKQSLGRNEPENFENPVPISSAKEAPTNLSETHADAAIMHSEKPLLTLPRKEIVRRQLYEKRAVEQRSKKGTQAAKRFYEQEEMTQEGIQQKKPVLQSETENFANSIPISSAKEVSTNLPETPVDAAVTHSEKPPPMLSRKESMRRQFYRKGPARKQAEKGISQDAAQYVADISKPRTKRPWKEKRQIFVRHAAWQKLQEQSVGTHKLPFSRPASPRMHSFSAVRRQLTDSFRRVLHKLAAVLGRAVRAALRSSLALFGAGGVVLLLVMIVGATAAMIGSPMGILFSNETGDPNAVPIADIVQEVNADFGQAINDIVEAHPECSETDIQYHYEAGRTWGSYWPEVLALFAVHTNLGQDNNVIVIDAANVQRIRDTFWTMHTITSWVETIEIQQEENAGSGEGDEENTETNESEPAPQYRYILHISISGKTVSEMENEYHFTYDQREILQQLLSSEMRPALLALCSGISGGGIAGGGAQGNLLWPLPGISNITCRFGEPDAIRGQPHRGVDIAAPQGTPILAAHDGVVMISGWNDSYGNQVLLDNGAGLSTRYAHMTATAVQAGEAVTAGQVIGYVGSTGDSTGNHLHFELMVNGTRTDPLSACQG